MLPGDTVNLNVKWFCRLATQVVPLLDNMYMDAYFFFVPNRLVWEHWEQFCGAVDDPDTPIEYVLPVIENLSVAEDSIFDHFGLPITRDGTKRPREPLL